MVPLEWNGVLFLALVFPLSFVLTKREIDCLLVSSKHVSKTRDLVCRPRKALNVKEEIIEN